MGSSTNGQVVSRSSPATAARVLDDLRQDALRTATGWGSPIATGFDLVDRVLDGGLRRHDLMLLGGSPGVGKTIAALQAARRAALDGRPSLYVSYEHDEATLVGRLLVLELGELTASASAADGDRLPRLVTAAVAGFDSLDELVASEPLLAAAVESFERYAERLSIVRGRGGRTDVAELERELLASGGGDPPSTGAVLVVDYLQKVAVHPEPAEEAEKVTRVVEGLKDLAMRHDVAVVALVAADWDGVGGGRARLHHLRGSSALAYECDVAVMMNDKHGAVSKVHLAYDPVKAESFRHQVVFSIEKNRGGPAMVDLEFRKDFLHYRFDTTGRYLTERLVDDRLGGE